jgi:tyrosyl-tRNA synthetase
MAADERVLDILRRLNMVSSGKEGKRLIEQNGVRLNDQPVDDSNFTITLDMLPAILQVGKRKFVKLVAGS